MASKKHYVIVSLTLGIIAACSAGLISVANLITKNRIAQNEVNKINSGIREIFGKNAIISSEFDKKDAGFVNEYKYVSYVYEVADDSENEIGYAFRTTGSNMYGKISLIVGYRTNGQLLMGFTVVTNEQTYATTLVDKYITPVNDKTRALDDVNCGATYGAKLVRDMVEEAKKAAEELWKE